MTPKELYEIFNSSLPELTYRGAWDGHSSITVDGEVDLAALAAKLTALFAVPEERETGWLVENGENGGERRYRTIEQGFPAWTEDHNKAIRFARRADAEMFCAEDEDAWRIAEHQWHSSPQKTT